MYRLNFVFFGIWIGLLISGSAAVELFLQGQIYSFRTMMVVAIFFIAGTASSALSWMLFSRFARTTIMTCLILCVANLMLFGIMGVLTSYLIHVVPHFFAPDQGNGYDGDMGLVLKIVFGILGTGFSFKTFGLPLLWPIGAILGLTGTFIFVYINKRLNFGARH